MRRASPMVIAAAYRRPLFDVVVVIAPDILLSHETGGAQRRDVIGVGGREQLADQRQRSDRMESRNRRRRARALSVNAGERYG